MLKIILSGGGTGGHIYPAVSVAQALKTKLGDNVELLFVGALGKMEMQLIPQLGYKIIGVPIAGLQRKFTAKNLLLPFKVISSLRKASKIIDDFKPDVVVGFGGYASGPILYMAQHKGVPTLIQEQNSYAGLVNKIVAKRAKKICTAYESMERFFDKEKIILTGNPLRSAFLHGSTNRAEAMQYYGLEESMPTIFVVGGSLGTRTLNEMIKKWIISLGGAEPNIQLIWQTGRYYEGEMKQFLADHPTKHIWQGAFITRMDYAYSAADVVISRSGACSVSELCLAGKPTLFVPSPNVAEDHQTKNAMALVNKDAAKMVADNKAIELGMSIALDMVKDRELLNTLSTNIRSLAIADSAERVANEVIKITKNEKR